MRLKILRQDVMDTTFLMPWKGRDIRVTYEPPIGCLNGGFRFEGLDDDEAEELDDFLWDNVSVGRTVTLKKGAEK